VSVLPGAVIGFLGGGQLGRMSAIAARSLGYGVQVLDPDAGCAASAVADHVVVGGFDDASAAAELAKGAAVVTYEIEKIGVAAARVVEGITPLRPSSHILEVVQDRLTQKQFLTSAGIPVGPYLPATSATEARDAFRALGGPVRIKARRGGYDGRGQARGGTAEETATAFDELGGVPCVVERELALAEELSVLIARRPGGEVAVFPPAQNWHEDGILTVSVIPGQLRAGIAAKAQELTQTIAVALGVEGLLAVEFFETEGGELFANELSPRPHNTFHATETACLTSQFEQLVRAICDLPLGSTAVLRPTALANLLGELWLEEKPPAFDRALALPGVRLNLYGKSPRRGRKMGHLLALADTPDAALALVKEARRRLTA
jgi:5-(carboxyamino)imidazole ribonucleotide synthase